MFAIMKQTERWWLVHVQGKSRYDGHNGFRSSDTLFFKELLFNIFY